jgi:dienelactone hydrolase
MSAAIWLGLGDMPKLPLGSPRLDAPMTPPEPLLQSTGTMIGSYGPWAASIAPDPPALSLRRGSWTDLDAWRTAARERLMQRLAQPETGGVPAVTVRRRYALDDLEVEELSWQLPYGPPTEAVLVRPRGAPGRLPAVLGLHDHSGNKYFGAPKITRGDDQHPLMAAHQAKMYEGRAWANELARRGYVVLVPDAFAFGSRRVRLRDVPEGIRGGLPADEPTTPEEIAAYNDWASEHEHIMAKSLFSAGTTWPGVFLAEDQRALDVLCARDDVDPERVGCSGLSGGGLRTVYLGGADPRIRCAVCVGMMTTWDDYLLNRSRSHTWMVYIPRLPLELDYPEVLGLRAPAATLVLNNREDPLFTLPEMQRADQILTDVYARAGVPDRYHASFHPGPHKFDRAMQEEAFAWFERWL